MADCGLATLKATGWESGHSPTWTDLLTLHGALFRTDSGDLGLEFGPLMRVLSFVDFSEGTLQNRPCESHVTAAVVPSRMWWKWLVA